MKIEIDDYFVGADGRHYKAVDFRAPRRGDMFVTAKTLFSNAREIINCIYHTEEQYKRLIVIEEKPRAKDGKKYHFIDARGFIQTAVESDSTIHEQRYVLGNYFISESDARNKLPAFRKLFE